LRRLIRFKKLELTLHYEKPFGKTRLNELYIHSQSLHQLFEVFAIQFQDLRKLSIHNPYDSAAYCDPWFPGAFDFDWPENRFLNMKRIVKLEKFTLNMKQAAVIIADIEKQLRSNDYCVWPELKCLVDVPLPLELVAKAFPKLEVLRYSKQKRDFDFKIISNYIQTQMMFLTDYSIGVSIHRRELEYICKPLRYMPNLQILRFANIFFYEDN
jgi:hypothetical protein